MFYISYISLHSYIVYIYLIYIFINLYIIFPICLGSLGYTLIETFNRDATKLTATRRWAFSTAARAPEASVCLSVLFKRVSVNHVLQLFRLLVLSNGRLIVPRHHDSTTAPQR